MEKEKLKRWLLAGLLGPLGDDAASLAISDPEARALAKKAASAVVALRKRLFSLALPEGRRLFPMPAADNGLGAEYPDPELPAPPEFRDGCFGGATFRELAARKLSLDDRLESAIGSARRTVKRALPPEQRQWKVCVSRLGAPLQGFGGDGVIRLVDPSRDPDDGGDRQYVEFAAELSGKPRVSAALSARFEVSFSGGDVWPDPRTCAAGYRTGADAERLADFCELWFDARLRKAVARATARLSERTAALRVEAEAVRKEAERLAVEELSRLLDEFGRTAAEGMKNVPPEFRTSWSVGPDKRVRATVSSPGGASRSLVYDVVSEHTWGQRPENSFPPDWTVEDSFGIWEPVQEKLTPEQSETWRALCAVRFPSLDDDGAFGALPARIGALRRFLNSKAPFLGKTRSSAEEWRTAAAAMEGGGE